MTQGYVKFVKASLGDIIIRQMDGDGYLVRNRMNQHLGLLVRGKVGRRKRWKFEPEPQTFHTSECLRVIADKLEELEAGA